MSSIDYKGPYRTERFIATCALECWKLGTLPKSNMVDLHTILSELEAHGVESIFQVPGIAKKGRLRITTEEDDPRESPAFVKFTPRLTMHVQKGVRERFNEGRSEERVIIAHEIGHIMLHNDDPKQFSRDDSLQIKFAENEYSVEWQANRFADHLLIPTPIAERIMDVERLAFVCNVPERFAYERLCALWNDKKIMGAVPNGTTCSTCGGFSVTDGNRGCQVCQSRL